MTVHTLDLSSFGPAELMKVEKLVFYMMKENDGFKKGPQIILMDDTDGMTWMTDIKGEKVAFL